MSILIILTDSSGEPGLLSAAHRERPGLLDQSDSLFKPVNPSVQSVRLQVRTGRTAVSGRAPGPDGYLGVRPDDCPGRTGGPCRCLRWRNFPGNAG